MTVREFYRFLAVVLSVIACLSLGLRFELLINQENQKVAGYDYAGIETDFLQGFTGYSLYDSSEFTGDALLLSDGVVIVRCVGEVTDAAAGDGRLLNPRDPAYDYIAYRECGIPLENGELVLTYLVYAPDTRDADDISARYDFVLAE